LEIGECRLKIVEGETILNCQEIKMKNDRQEKPGTPSGSDGIFHSAINDLKSAIGLKI
jgi:hypothetical protein